MIPQETLFEEERLNPRRAMQLTIESLTAYGALYDHWAVAFSGGKDSTAALTIVCHLVETRQVPVPKSLRVLYADTRMELPPLQIGALRLMQAIRERSADGRLPCPVTTEVVLPPMDQRFFVYMLGRGVPPPTNRFRWCTPQIKVEPMLAALLLLRENLDEKFLMLTGVRIGESAARDQRIALSCGRDGAECGQGWFQGTTPDSVADTLAPCLHWRVCHIWNWLLHEAGSYGYPTAGVALAYGGDKAEEVNARTGCVGCNLASKDLALERLVSMKGFDYLKPLLRLRPLYTELRKSRNRLRKHGEYHADGSFHATDRLGPLTMDARRWALEQVLTIQNEIADAGAVHGLPNTARYSLIDPEEASRIRELIGDNTWPNRWDGTEDRGDLIRPVRFLKGGGRQMQMLIEQAVEA